MLKFKFFDRVGTGIPKVVVAKQEQGEPKILNFGA
jgi:hypothetical protein